MCHFKLPRGATKTYFGAQPAENISTLRRDQSTPTGPIIGTRSTVFNVSLCFRRSKFYNILRSLFRLATDDVVVKLILSNKISLKIHARVFQAYRVRVQN